MPLSSGCNTSLDLSASAISTVPSALSVINDVISSASALHNSLNLNDERLINLLTFVLNEPITRSSFLQRAIEKLSLSNTRFSGKIRYLTVSWPAISILVKFSHLEKSNIPSCELLIFV